MKSRETTRAGWSRLDCNAAGRAVPAIDPARKGRPIPIAVATLTALLALAPNEAAAPAYPQRTIRDPIRDFAPISLVAASEYILDIRAEHARWGKAVKATGLPFE